MTPPREISPRVGLIPTAEFTYEGRMTDPAVSVPTVEAASPDAADTAGPPEEPLGSPLV